MVLVITVDRVIFSPVSRIGGFYGRGAARTVPVDEEARARRCAGRARRTCELDGMRFMHKSLRALKRRGEGRPRDRGGRERGRGAARRLRYAGFARTINYLLIPSKKPVQVRPSGHTETRAATPARCTRTHTHTGPPAWTVFYRHI